MVTPATPEPSPKKQKPLQDTGPCEDSSAKPSPDRTTRSSPPGLLPPTNTKLEPFSMLDYKLSNQSMLDSIMAEAEEDMTNEDCATLVKSEEVEKVTACDSHQGRDQVPGEWADLEKFVIVQGKGGRRRSFQCSLCGKVMARSLNRTMAHVEAKHFRKLFTHTCDVCQETFKTKAILTNHIKRIHKAQTL